MDTNEKIDLVLIKLDSIDEQITDLRTGLTHLELLCENEIPKKIQFVAEGHSILFRRLDEITKQLSDHEYDRIRMDVLESRVNRLEECFL